MAGHSPQRFAWTVALAGPPASRRRGRSRWPWSRRLDWSGQCLIPFRFPLTALARDPGARPMASNSSAGQGDVHYRAESVPSDEFNARSRSGAAMCPVDTSMRIPPSWGGPLTESDYAALGLSWITRLGAEEAMLRRVNDFEGREIIGQKGNRDCSGILFSSYWPGEPSPNNYRVRRDNPDLKYDKDGKPKPDKKYLGSPKSSNRLYIPPGITPEQLQDVTIPIVIAEGEKKSLALWRLAQHETDALRFVPVALAGVWNWLGTIGKTGGPKGERLDVKGPIADLGRIPWGGRRVFIVFDANVHTNDSVKWARNGICRELASRTADVRLVSLP